MKNRSRRSRRGPQSILEANLALQKEIRERSNAQREKEQLVEQMRSECAMFKTVLKQMPTGILIVDADGKVLLGNDQDRRACGGCQGDTVIGGVVIFYAKHKRMGGGAYVCQGESGGEVIKDRTKPSFSEPTGTSKWRSWTAVRPRSGSGRSGALLKSMAEKMIAALRCPSGNLLGRGLPSYILC
jgi:hypothetical protein